MQRPSVSPQKTANKFAVFMDFVVRSNSAGPPLIEIVRNKNKSLQDFFLFGDLEESRTPIDGMKTRCTNRYTTRP